MTAVVLPVPTSCAFCTAPPSYALEDNGATLSVCREHIEEAIEWDSAWDGVA